jgi:uncharacterized membrane protein
VKRPGEPRWPAALALLACVLLYVLLPDRLVVGPRWIVPVLVGLPLIPLLAVRHHHPNQSPWIRHCALFLIGVVTLANIASVVLLINRLLATNITQGSQLISSAVSIWLTNVIVYGVWFWEVDREGPAYRAAGIINRFDLQFPQMENPSLAPPEWRPRFIDYLYTSFANGTSFAPADAMPLTHRMKVLFASESVVSLVAISVVAARAVNILR